MLSYCLYFILVWLAFIQKHNPLFNSSSIICRWVHVSMSFFVATISIATTSCLVLHATSSSSRHSLYLDSSICISSSNLILRSSNSCFTVIHCYMLYFVELFNMLHVQLPQSLVQIMVVPQFASKPANRRHVQEYITNSLIYWIAQFPQSSKYHK